MSGDATAEEEADKYTYYECEYSFFVLFFVLLLFLLYVSFLLLIRNTLGLTNIYNFFFKYYY